VAPELSIIMEEIHTIFGISINSPRMTIEIAVIIPIGRSKKPIAIFR
jgi:hypothetical protein